MKLNEIEEKDIESWGSEITKLINFFKATCLTAEVSCCFGLS